jgi:hypothetical protein
MGRERVRRESWVEVGGPAARAPGAAERGRSALLRRAAEDVRRGGSLRERAARGVAGASGELPHRAAIERSFGPGHDLGDLRARVGGAAAEASEAMAADGYTYGRSLGFRRWPSVREAAHEAAHAEQQRAGVTVADGADRPHTRHERDADAIADGVAGGRSVTHLLPTPAPGAAVARPSLQRKLKIGGETWKRGWLIDRDGDDAVAEFKQHFDKHHADFPNVPPELEYNFWRRVREMILSERDYEFADEKSFGEATLRGSRVWTANSDVHEAYIRRRLVEHREFARTTRSQARGKPDESKQVEQTIRRHAEQIVGDPAMQAALDLRRSTLQAYSSGQTQDLEQRRKDFRSSLWNALQDAERDEDAKQDVPESAPESQPSHGNDLVNHMKDEARKGVVEVAESLPFVGDVVKIANTAYEIYETGKDIYERGKEALDFPKRVQQRLQQISDDWDVQKRITEFREIFIDENDWEMADVAAFVAEHKPTRFDVAVEVGSGVVGAAATATGGAAIVAGVAGASAATVASLGLFPLIVGGVTLFGFVGKAGWKWVQSEAEADKLRALEQADASERKVADFSLANHRTIARELERVRTEVPAVALLTLALRYRSAPPGSSVHRFVRSLLGDFGQDSAVEALVEAFRRCMKL